MSHILYKVFNNFTLFRSKLETPLRQAHKPCEFSFGTYDICWNKWHDSSITNQFNWLVVSSSISITCNFHIFMLSRVLQKITVQKFQILTNILLISQGKIFQFWWNREYTLFYNINFFFFPSFGKPVILVLFMDIKIWMDLHPSGNMWTFKWGASYSSLIRNFKDDLNFIHDAWSKFG